MKDTPNVSPLQPLHSKQSQLRSNVFKVILALSTATGISCKPDATNNPDQVSCDDFELEVEKSWNTGIRAKILEYGGEIEVERRRAVVNKMDRSSEDWVRLNKSTCEDYNRGFLSAEDYVRRTTCYNNWLIKQRTLVELLASGASLDNAEKAMDDILNNSTECN